MKAKSVARIVASTCGEGERLRGAPEFAYGAPRPPWSVVACAGAIWSCIATPRMRGNLPAAKLGSADVAEWRNATARLRMLRTCVSGEGVGNIDRRQWCIAHGICVECRKFDAKRGQRCRRCANRNAERERRRYAEARRKRMSLIEADIQFVRDLVQHAGYTGEQFVTVGRERLLSVLAHVESLEVSVRQLSAAVEQFRRADTAKVTNG
jgi:hypothetical protein